MRLLARAGRLDLVGKTLCYVRYIDDFPVFPYSNLWTDTVTSGFSDKKVYVVQTNASIVERCLLMTTDPGDLVFDPTCGSGTTAYVAEKWGRRWITCDTSRVAVTLAKQRLMTASFDYYELRYPHEGLRGGFIWKTVPHVTLKSIANNPDIDAIYERLHPAIEQALADLNKALKAKAQEWEVPFDFPDGADEKARPAFEAFHAARQAMQKAMDRSIADHADQETLYDQPAKSKAKLRITGPFSVEAVPFPTVQSLDQTDEKSRHGRDGMIAADVTIARCGESSRQHQWRDELLKSGIRGKGGQILKFAELETLPGTKYLHATGHTDDGQRVVVHFGPEHAALEQRAVTNALEEAGNLFPLPKMIVFCAFAFDPEAAKDIDHLKGITALKAQMNTDLLTEDLKKARSSNQSFWLMGQPDVAVRKRKDGLYEVEVNGFDYFDTAKGELVSGGKGRIALWSLDTDYDERSLFPHQVFFPLAGKGEGWEKLKKDIRAELDEDALEAFHGTVSLPFAAGDNRKIAVKIVDDRGIESLKIVGLED
jgi:adenine-specific DNA-methyltransferase